MEIKNTPIENIKPYGKNAKKHPKDQVKKIANSIKEFGFNQPIVVDKDNVIIVGHGRLEGAKALGLTEVPVLTVDLTEEQAKAYRLADNKLNESEWDMDLVFDELKQLEMVDIQLLELTGFEFDKDENFDTDFSLADGDKNPFQQITFTLSDEQAKVIKDAITYIKTTDEYKYIETFGNENSNGNALYCLISSINV